MTSPRSSPRVGTLGASVVLFLMWACSGDPLGAFEVVARSTRDMHSPWLGAQNVSFFGTPHYGVFTGWETDALCRFLTTSTRTDSPVVTVASDALFLARAPVEKVEEVKFYAHPGDHDVHCKQVARPMRSVGLMGSGASLI